MCLFFAFPRFDTHCVICDFFVQAPCVLRKCGRHPERQQPDHRVHRWQDVLVEFGYAVTASGQC